MPWSNSKLEARIDHNRKRIKEFMGILPEARVLLCTRDEMCERVKGELLVGGRPVEKVAFLEKHIFPLLLGKYFKDSGEIWILEGKRDADTIVVHELLHSIQKCNPKRENICDYLVYRITNDPTIMESNLRLEWAEIEHVHGLDKIKSRFLSDGNCEAF